ncbi:hypothetical protein BI081_gp229 [Mycobacterium phage Tonenili]|uniref:Minor tail protein n=1 Tax=Mycobacterium phage Tonenili TaxID=1891703 RepID=A0A1C9EHB2_9CAUD|nr:hypothetical protein BI081_gp229 [Mycobacterium phage Tonenili]AON96878.1 hypothetical protein SEA_TONENILI_131 [Mycobacterium phage Tonenili]
MAVVFDNASTVGTGGTSIPAFTIANDATAVVAWISCQVSSGTDLSGMTATIGGQSMAKQIFSPTESLQLINLRLLNPPTGSQGITLTGLSGAARYYAGIAASYKGVRSFGAVVSGTANSISPTVNCSSELGDMVSNGIMYSGSLETYNQTLRGNKNTAAFVNQGVLLGDAPGAPSVQFQMTMTNSGQWICAALPLIGEKSSGNFFPLIMA